MTAPSSPASGRTPAMAGPASCGTFPRAIAVSVCRWSKSSGNSARAGRVVSPVIGSTTMSRLSRKGSVAVASASWRVYARRKPTPPRSSRSNSSSTPLTRSGVGVAEDGRVRVHAERHRGDESGEALDVDAHPHRELLLRPHPDAQLVLAGLLESEVRIAPAEAAGAGGVVERGIHQELVVRRLAETPVARDHRRAAQHRADGESGAHRVLGAAGLAGQAAARVEPVVAKPGGDGDVRDPQLSFGVRRGAARREGRSRRGRHGVAHREKPSARWKVRTCWATYSPPAYRSSPGIPPIVPSSWNRVSPNRFQASSPREPVALEEGGHAPRRPGARAPARAVPGSGRPRCSAPAPGPRRRSGSGTR